MGIQCLLGGTCNRANRIPRLSLSFTPPPQSFNFDFNLNSVIKPQLYNSTLNLEPQAVCLKPVRRSRCPYYIGGCHQRACGRLQSVPSGRGRHPILLRPPGDAVRARLALTSAAKCLPTTAAPSPPQHHSAQGAQSGPNTGATRKMRTLPRNKLPSKFHANAMKKDQHSWVRQYARAIPMLCCARRSHAWASGSKGA